MKVCATLIQRCRKICKFCPRWSRDALYPRHQNNDVRRYLAMGGSSDVRQYSTMVDTYDEKFGSGMYAAHGYSLYLSQATILDCVVFRFIIVLGIPDDSYLTLDPLLGADMQTAECACTHYGSGFRNSRRAYVPTATQQSYRPCRIEGGCLSCDGTEKEKALVKEQSARDWEQFVYMRGKELSPGGYLVVLNCGADKDGKGLFPIKGEMPQLGKLLSTMLHDGLITQEEFLDANFDVDIYRTEEDHSRPFTQGDRLTQMGLELVSVRSFTNWLEHHTFDIVHKDEATKAEYAERVVAGIKPWFYHVIYNGLSRTRPQEERMRLTDLYFDRMRVFAHDNHGGKTQIPLHETVVRKRL